MRYICAMASLFIMATSMSIGGEAKTMRVERIDLLELRDLIHQMDALKMQMSISEKRIKELDKDTQDRFKTLAEKYKLEKDDTINMETGEIISKSKEGKKPDEK